MTKPNPFQPKPRGGVQDALNRIRAWVRAAMPVDDRETISITELACAEPGCPPRETVIVIMPTTGAWLKARVHKALGDVIEDDVLWALRKAELVTRPT
ncbi:MAG: hypothetical protein R3D51_03520 [Hyphomicrobiaceae bacterium]